MSPTLAARRARRILYVSIAVGLASLLVGLVIALASIRQTQLDGTPTGRKLVASADRILDCTETTGECYMRNQQRTAELVTGLNDYQLKVVAAGAACSSSLADQHLPIRLLEIRINACMVARLAAEKP